MFDIIIFPFLTTTVSDFVGIITTFRLPSGTKIGDSVPLNIATRDDEPFEGFELFFIKLIDLFNDRELLVDSDRCLLRVTIIDGTN